MNQDSKSGIKGERVIRWSHNSDITVVVAGNGKIGNASNRTYLLKLHSRMQASLMNSAGNRDGRHLFVVRVENPILMLKYVSGWRGEEGIRKTEPRRNTYGQRGHNCNEARNARFGVKGTHDTNQASGS